MMKYLIIFYCVFNTALAAREKQLKLEDIEKDNLASERQYNQPRPNKGETPIPLQYNAPPQQDHTKQQQLYQSIQHQPQYATAVPPREQIQSQYVLNQPRTQQLQQHFQPPQSQSTAPQVQYGFKPMKTQPEYVQANAAPQYVNHPAEQFAVPQYFAYHPTITQPYQQIQSKAQQYVQSHSPRYQQELQLPYHLNNQLVAQDTNTLQQFYTPQYVYLQQYPQASNSIQTVVDPKGGIQYVMYLTPDYLQGSKTEQSRAVETLLQPQGQAFEQVYAPNQETAPVNEQYQFVDVPQPEIQIQPNYADIQYPQIERQIPPKYESIPQKHEPNSLLDSYVPSVLQLQYYKQQQQQVQANAIRNSFKNTQPIIGKNDLPKNYVSRQIQQPQNFNYFQYKHSPPQQHRTNSQKVKH